MGRQSGRGAQAKLAWRAQKQVNSAGYNPSAAGETSAFWCLALAILCSISKGFVSGFLIFIVLSPFFFTRRSHHASIAEFDGKRSDTHTLCTI